MHSTVPWATRSLKKRPQLLLCASYPATDIVPSLTLDVVKEKKYEMRREQLDAKIQHQGQRDNWTKVVFIKTYLPLLKKMKKPMFGNRRLFWTRCFRHPTAL
jgi:hypothetical protein